MRKPALRRLAGTLLVEFALADDMVGRETDAETIATFYGIEDDDVCDGAGAPCVVAGSASRAWGAGIVQRFDRLGSSAFLAYRHRELEARVHDEEGARVPAPPFEGLGTLMLGFALEF